MEGLACSEEISVPYAFSEASTDFADNDLLCEETLDFEQNVVIDSPPVTPQTVFTFEKHLMSTIEYFHGLANKELEYEQASLTNCLDNHPQLT
jgi:hypothetical protein